MTHSSVEMARKIIAEAVALSVADVPEDASIDTFSAWDSLAHIRIILGLEAVTGAPLSTDAIANLHSIQDVVAVLARR